MDRTRGKKWASERTKLKEGRGRWWNKNKRGKQKRMKDRTGESMRWRDVRRRHSVIKVACLKGWTSLLPPQASTYGRFMSFLIQYTFRVSEVPWRELQRQVNNVESRKSQRGRMWRFQPQHLDTVYLTAICSRLPHYLLLKMFTAHISAQLLLIRLELQTYLVGFMCC